MNLPKKSYMRCVSFCTATSYDLPKLANSIKRKGWDIRLSRDVLHLSSTMPVFDLFFFNHGSFVSWGLNKRKELQWLDKVAPFANQPIKNIEIDHFVYIFGDDTSIDSHERFKSDVITLESDNPLIKLAISYALAQSVKLEDFEESLQGTIKRNAIIPEQIANKGKISLSRTMILKHIGEIFLARSSINLNSENLDAPEFFWRNPNLEQYYVLTKNYLEIPSRVAALNQKLDVLQDLLDILNSQVQHRHSSILEMIIIILILIEIAISLLHSW